MPRILSASYFNAEPGGRWARLARVLAHSAATHCPAWARRIEAITPAPLTSALGIPSHVHNTQKMAAWAEAVDRAPEGAELLLIDADTVILRPLDDVWDRIVDVGYTTKASRFPFNSGVVFLRVSPRTRAFVRAWLDENIRMLGDKTHHVVWRQQYGGINQAALGYMLTQRPPALQMLELPCAEWNCEDASWPAFDPAVTRILHIKGALRRALFPGAPVRAVDDPGVMVRRLAALWIAQEQDAIAADAAPATVGAES